MSEALIDTVTAPWRASTDQIAMVSALVALPGVLLIAPTIGGSSALNSIGIVLAEALALYLGYGAVTRVAGPPIRGLLASE